MAEVSIIVPVYNVETKLRRCVESLINQTFAEIEILLVDDGSIDRSLAICQELANEDSRIRVIHQDNQGVSVARNTGINASKSNWLMFVDSDDWIEANTVEYMLQLVKKLKADIGVFSFINEYNDNTCELSVPDSCYAPANIIRDYRGIKNLEAVICSVCNKLYKRNIIVDNEIMFEHGIKFAEDFIFNSNVYKFSQKVVTCSKPFYHYDCTSELSGVKKLHPNYDEFIVASQRAAEDMCLKLGVPEKERFVHDFIGNQWNYAVNVCLDTPCTSKKCADLLLKWRSSMPAGICDWESVNGQTKRLIQIREINELEAEIKHIGKEAQKRKAFNRIKRFIRRVIIR